MGNLVYLKSKTAGACMKTNSNTNRVHVLLNIQDNNKLGKGNVLSDGLFCSINGWHVHPYRSA